MPTRAPCKPKPISRPRLILAPGPDDEGSVVIYSKREPHGSTYFLRLLRTEWGRGFTLEKAADWPDAAKYAVNINGDGYDSCECKGFCKTGGCKHVLAMRSLVENGELP